HTHRENVNATSCLLVPKLRALTLGSLTSKELKPWLLLASPRKPALSGSLSSRMVPLSVMGFVGVTVPPKGNCRLLRSRHDEKSGQSVVPPSTDGLATKTMRSAMSSSRTGSKYWAPESPPVTVPMSTVGTLLFGSQNSQRCATCRIVGDGPKVPPFAPA